MRFSSRAGVAGLLATNVFALPSPPQASGASGSGVMRQKLNLNAYRLKTASTYSNASTALEPGLTNPLVPIDYVAAAIALVRSEVPGLEFRVVDDHYISSNGIAHVHFKQTVHGLDIDNADFNVNIDPAAALKGAKDVLALPITADQAVAAPVEDEDHHYVFEGCTGTVSEPKAKLVYFQNPDSTLTLVWRVETDVTDNWVLSYVHAITGTEVLGVVDYVSDASYTVYPWMTANDPSKGVRVVETNPYDSDASEFTWHGTGTTTYDTTRGNNAIAQANWEGDSSYLNDYRPTSSSLNFNYGLDLANSNPRTYANASVTQLFYTVNMYHDLLYSLGFNEAAGNFETNNDGQGGRGNDAVILNAQDGSSTNNADFSTPPDGQAGRMRMFMWTTTSPARDCAFDAGVIVHEYTHGLSTRLTGGPANSGCLEALESGGMGEGWGDFMAIATFLKTTDTRETDYPLGAWVYNNPLGIRAYLYSTSMETNPYTYATINTLNEVHDIGEIWATILYEVLWNLVDEHGITAARKPTFDSNGVPTDGRYLAMKIIIDAMALQPCSPTMITARNAIIDADLALTGGVNKCLLWKAFAKRGLGSDAAQGTGSNRRVESFTLPSDCSTTA